MAAEVITKWIAETTGAVRSLLGLEKATQGVGSATKKTGQSLSAMTAVGQELRGEMVSQLRTMAGVGAMVQFAGNMFRSYTVRLQESARVTLDVAQKHELATGRINEMALASRLAARAQRILMISGENLRRQQEKQIRTAQLGRSFTGRLGMATQKGLAQIPGLGPLIEFAIEETLQRTTDFGGRNLADPTTVKIAQRSQILQRAEAQFQEARGPLERNKIEREMTRQLDLLNQSMTPRANTET